jgi:hypothetical protein
MSKQLPKYDKFFIVIVISGVLTLLAFVMGLL